MLAVCHALDLFLQRADSISNQTESLRNQAQPAEKRQQSEGQGKTLAKTLQQPESSLHLAWMFVLDGFCQLLPAEPFSCPFNTPQQERQLVTC